MLHATLLREHLRLWACAVGPGRGVMPGADCEVPCPRRHHVLVVRHRLCRHGGPVSKPLACPVHLCSPARVHVSAASAQKLCVCVALLWEG